MSVEPSDRGPAPTSWTHSRRTAEDVICRSQITFQDIDGFLSACEATAEAINELGATIAFAPMRGAGPISWVTQAAMVGSAIRTRFEPLLIGTRSLPAPAGSAMRWRLRGMSRSDKARVIAQSLERLHSGGVLTERTRCALLDEVQYGSTITTHAALLQQELRRLSLNDGLTVLSVMDGRTKARRLSRHDQLGENLAVEHHTVEVPRLFTVDSVPLLDAIVDLEPGSPPGTDSLHLEKNLESRRVFEHLWLTWREPVYREALLAKADPSDTAWWPRFARYCQSKSNGGS